MKSPFLLTLLAAALAFFGMAGSVYLSSGMGLIACPLCFYQRTFVMAAFAALVLGLLIDRRRVGVFCIVALPLELAGLAVAVYHWYLLLNGTLVCPDGIWGLGSPPFQSLLMFIILTAVTAAGAWFGREPLPARGFLIFPAVVVLAVLLTWASLVSTPPGQLAPIDKDTGQIKGCGLPHPKSE